MLQTDIKDTRVVPASLFPLDKYYYSSSLKSERWSHEQTYTCMLLFMKIKRMVHATHDFIFETAWKVYIIADFQGKFIEP